ncbi:thioredoxin domain-containing protein [Streptomyces sp. A7024]|uniref:Thioredoxin domain-containing protein n=1 Tax=Streptomyces coryli TaxID=1128680 RepID=A0A6G4U282_9ACTN|nr:thioredoxin domain-containing protein [Streptomyces coryli]NGN65860.1 thioredoxin domain-containing protein [Streptomyces coryli]
MSKRNSQEAKRAARERLRVEREKQAKKERTKRQLIVGGTVIAVIAAGVGIAFGVSKMSDDDKGSSDWQAAAKAKLAKPANAEGTNGTSVSFGKGKRTVDVYEDMRCPACASFEQTLGSTVKKGADDGKYTLKYHLGAIIDGNFGGDGSKNAASALGAALNVSPEAFSEYHELLYSKDHHPAESEDKFADDSYLLDVAKNVKELKGNAKFESAVKKGTYDRWALEMIKDFGKEKQVTGTPTVLIDGKKVDTDKVPAELVKMGVKVA